MTGRAWTNVRDPHGIIESYQDPSSSPQFSVTSSQERRITRTRQILWPCLDRGGGISFFSQQLGKEKVIRI